MTIALEPNRHACPKPACRLSQPFVLVAAVFVVDDVVLAVEPTKNQHKGLCYITTNVLKKFHLICNYSIARIILASFQTH